ncbi:insulinase family protein [candidate division KSB1 bacterium]|nr:insulinase family protein [candidate division KSB1 bacterium]
MNELLNQLQRVSLLLIFSTLAFAQTKVEDIRTFTLANGMKIIVLEDHSIPNANMYFFWQVGSRNEYPGITGLSHFFEHMMFNGAQKYGPKEFDRVMEANGGSNNAYTTENITVYTDWFPSESIEVIFDLEADRIGNLALDDDMVESERGVVLSERITGLENSNWRLLSEQLKSVAFVAHPYRWSVIGYESDIKNWTKQDLQRYFDTYYAPNNGMVVIVGDVTFEQVRKLTKEYFEPIPAQEPPRPIHTAEPEQLGEKRLWVKKDITSPNIMIAYHTAETKSEDYYALELFNSLLSEGRSSRLYNQLIDEKQIAVEVFTYYPLAFDPNLFYIYAVCSKGIPEDTVEQAIYAEIEKIKSHSVSENELQKVKNRKLVDFYHQMETINGKANTIGTYELFFGDYKKLFSAPDEYQKVTLEDIKRVAAKYFKQSNRTVGILKKLEDES